MSEKIWFFLYKNRFASLILIWLFLYFSLWTIWLESMPWIRLGISIIIFSTPGIITSLILAGKRLSLLSHFISGLAFSVFFVGSLGLLGRIFHLPFSYIKPVFALAFTAWLVSRTVFSGPISALFLQPVRRLASIGLPADRGALTSLYLSFHASWE